MHDQVSILMTTLYQYIYVCMYVYYRLGSNPFKTAKLGLDFIDGQPSQVLETHLTPLLDKGSQ